MAGTLFALIFVVLTGFARSEDLPCRARDVNIAGRSIVCVCDATYCDTITRVAPEPGQYVVYTSSDSGKRFEKSFGIILTQAQESPEDTDEADSFDEIIDDETGEIVGGNEKFLDIDFETLLSNVVLRLYTNTRFQTIEGFGGSVTDAASINWRKLSDIAQTNLIKSYFSSEGIEYNMIRVPIGGSDFSTHPYTYNELPWNDGALSNYTLAYEDLFYKLPMIKRSQHFATSEIKITASTWSPPLWMKTNERITGFAQLKPQYYQTYVDYHMRFLEEYEKAQVKIWAITTTNEPINGIVPLVDFNSLGWTPSQLGHWIANNLGPTLRSSRFNETLILAVDDQRYIIPIWLRGMERANPKSIEYIDGIAIHYYGNFMPASILSALHRRYQGKILVSTEACEGPMPWDTEKVSIGSWRRAGNYIKSILQDLNNFVVAWIDWNLCLDENGGPNWAHNFVDAPILVYGDQDEFIKQPMFYAMGHFSKFIPRGSIRINASRRSLATIENVAVLTPEGNLVMVVQNRKSRTLNVTIRISNTRYIELTVEPNTVKTIEINPNEN